MAGWRTLDGESIDDVYEAIREDNNASVENGGQLYAAFGTDSQNLGNRGTSFVQCITLHMISESGTGKGGRVYYIRFVERKHDVRFTRLLREAELTIKLMHKVSPLFDELDIPWVPHVDVASDPKWGSYEAYKVCKGWFNGFGVDAVFKPNAWVASIVADRHTRGVKISKPLNAFSNMKKRSKR
jgi:predicted RNase H-related nuclease YkuK (DUF458 family)